MPLIVNKYTIVFIPCLFFKRRKAGIFFYVAYIKNAFHHTRMKFIGVCFFIINGRLYGRGIFYGSSEIVDAIALCFPAAVNAPGETITAPVNGDGSYHTNAPRIQHTFYLYHFMSSAATPHIKHGLRSLRQCSIFIYPMAENIGAVTTKIIPLQWYIFIQIKSCKCTKLIIKNFCNTACQNTPGTCTGKK